MAAKKKQEKQENNNILKSLETSKENKIKQVGVQQSQFLFQVLTQSNQSEVNSINGNIDNNDDCQNREEGKKKRTQIQ